MRPAPLFKEKWGWLFQASPGLGSQENFKLTPSRATNRAECEKVGMLILV